MCIIIYVCILFVDVRACALIPFVCGVSICLSITQCIAVKYFIPQRGIRKLRKTLNIS